MIELVKSLGFRVGEILLPPFHVVTGEFIALVVPSPYGSEWYQLLRCLMGLELVEGLKVQASTVKGRLLSTSLDNHDLLALSLPHYLEGLGITGERSIDLLTSLKIPAELLVEDLQWTTRLELDISIAHYQKAQLVAYTTSGLDPTGKRRIGDRVANKLRQCSAINIISTQSYPLDLSLSIYSRYIKCDFASS